MPLYRVRHRHKHGHGNYENTVAAPDEASAINARVAELGLDDEEDDYTVDVYTVPDPDGRREAYWREHFGQ